MHSFPPQHELRLRSNTAALIFLAKLTLWRDHFTRKFDADQPRVPAGSPDGGQWSDGGTGDLAGAAVEAAVDVVTETLAPVVLVGGFDKDDFSKTVQDFVSEKCRGQIRAELPGQFEHMTIAEVLALAKSGDSGARTCKKLLERQEYRK